MSPSLSVASIPPIDAPGHYLPSIVHRDVLLNEVARTKIHFI